MKATAFFIGLLCVASSAYAQHHKPTLQKQSLLLVFRNRVGSNPLQLGEEYQNPFNETFSVRNFRYYISHISLEDSSGKKIVGSNDIYLIDEKDSASRFIHLSIPIAHIKKIHFIIGIDSIKNVSGVQTGLLDPAKGMFWFWNTGYVMAKLEGSSSASTIAANSFTYHIGGYKTGENTVRKIALDIPLNNQQPLSDLTIDADINKWFSHVSAIHIAQTPVCHSPGALAVQIADNYAGMFSIEAVNK